MDVMRLADQFAAEGKTWVDSLDRTSVGSFSNADDVLAMAAAIKLTELAIHRNFKEVPSLVESDYLSLLEKVKFALIDRFRDVVVFQNNGRRINEILEDAKDEVFYWWDKNGMNLEYQPPRRSERFDVSMNQVKRLRLLEHPERLPYYEVGIELGAEIEQFISAGVDASIACEVMSA